MKELAIKLSLASIAALAPIHAVMITVGVLIFADLFTGIWAARKEGIPFSSARARDSITKIAIYQTVIVTGFLVETHLLMGAVPIVKLAAGVIGMVEFTSLIENINIILGHDLFQKIIDKFGSKNKRPRKRRKNVRRR